MSTSVDDRHASITYRGRWTSRGGDSKFYGSTVSATNNNGATATFKFKGTKVKLYLVVPSGSSGTIKMRANLDDRSPFDQERNAHPYDVYNDIWFEASGLTDTEHTLVITNTGGEGGNAVQVDRFDIDGSPVSPQPPPPPPPPTKPASTSTPANTVITRVSSQTVTSIVFQTSTVTSSITASLTDSSSPTATPGSSGSGTQSLTSSTSGSIPTALSSQQSGGEKTVTAIQILTTAPNGSVQTITTTPGQQAAIGNSPNQLPIGAIIGGVAGAIVLLLIAGILAFLLIRRRKKRIALSDDSEHLTRERGAISAFPSENQDNTPPNSATVLRQRSNGTTITTSSRSRSAHHGFNSDEKHGDPYSSNSALESDENHSNYGTPTSEVGGNTALPLIETGGNNLHIRPHYLSGETLPADSPSIYSQAGLASAAPRDHLRLQDSHDVPPSYQSVGNRTSNVRQSIMNSAYLSYLSPRYSDHGPGFAFGSPPIEPQDR